MSSDPTKLIIVSALGRDRPGLVSGLTNVIADVDANIVDVEETVLRGLFAMFMIVDIRLATVSAEELKDRLEKKGTEVGLQVSVEPYVEGRRKPEKELALITILGKDRPGIVAKTSTLLGNYNINIEKIRMIARGEMIAMEMLVDLSDLQDALEKVRIDLQNLCETLGVGFILQRENIYHKSKKLIVFDMDSTLVDEETIDEIAKIAGVGEQVREITTKAMNGEIDFVEAVRERVKLLAGLEVKHLEEIAKNMHLTPGAEELISSLKSMGYKLALISGGFTFFTDRLKEKLGLDYAFGNKLIIKNGVLTGEVEKPIIDGEKKAEIIHWISEIEGISKDEIVAIGDGSNDQFMLSNVGLGIAFNAKQVLKQVADGVIAQKNLLSILYALGLPDRELKKYMKTD
ncbi:MAG: phosphoserine phosphatase SerB [Candidatus Lokiarchaeia archaeon]